MRRYITLLVAATASLVLVAFLAPLAFLIRDVAATRALSAATARAQSLAPMVATGDRRTVELTLQQAQSSGRPLTVLWPDGTSSGPPVPRDAAVQLAARGRSITVEEQGGREILVAVLGVPGGTAVISTFVTDDPVDRRPPVNGAPHILGIGPIRLLRGLAGLQRLDLAAHRRIHRAPPRLSLGALSALAEGADLRGRGGAAFPLARKLNAVADAARRHGRRTVVLVNATEGEPASAKDKVLLARVPHLVLDGAVLAARALGARKIVLGVTDGGIAERSLRSAVKEAGLAGRARIVHLPERFITGEGGALVRGVNGEPPIPPGRKVRAAESGVDGLPTLLSNAETFAQLAVLAELGAAGYRDAGTPSEPGTVLLTVTGPDRRTVVEAAAGVPLSEVLRRCGVTPGQGVLVGGYHGAWLTPEAAATVEVSRASMSAAGAALGAGIIVPLDEATCPLGEVARVADYLAAESAGQCGPCHLGLPAIARSVSSLAAGRSGAEALAAVRQGSGIVRGRGACHHPDGTSRFLLSALEVFGEDVALHQAGGCGRPVRRCLPVPGEAAEDSGVRLTVDWSRCAGHGLCAHLVPDLIELDVYGYPVLTDAPVPAGLLRDTLHATEMCPALALGLSRAPAADGRTTARR